VVTFTRERIASEGHKWQATLPLRCDRKQGIHLLRRNGTDEGPPGIRAQYNANYDGAFERDLDGNKIEAVPYTAREKLLEVSGCPAADWADEFWLAKTGDGVCASSSLVGQQVLFHTTPVLPDRRICAAAFGGGVGRLTVDETHYRCRSRSRRHQNRCDPPILPNIPDLHGLPKKLGTWAWLAQSLGHCPYEAFERARPRTTPRAAASSLGPRLNSFSTAPSVAAR
jgi:hypothetical protein